MDLALGLETIKVIKKRKLLDNATKMGNYLRKNLAELNGLQNVRGKGLMIAFDLPSKKVRNNVIVQCLKNGLVLLGCGISGIRVIPPYIISKEEIDIAVPIMEKAIKLASKSTFRHTGKICNYLSCGEIHS